MGNHREWRKIAKRERRRRIRKDLAQKRCTEEKAEQLRKSSDENYKTWVAEQEKLEAFKLIEAERKSEEENEKWLRRELIAQKEWRELQAKITKARFERTQQDLRIRQEWEEQQKKLKEEEEKRKQIEEEQKRCHEELMQRIEEFTSGIGDIPQELTVVKETNPDKEVCPFFSKIGICRFGDSCSRNHKKPGVSKVLLAKNFYSHFGIENSSANEYDTDILLEYEDSETYSHFKEFFEDVLVEFEKIGTIVQFKVCCNFEKHLRGNTYIEYATTRESMKAYKALHGRWYAGKQINLQFCDIPSWKQAICGLFASKQCPKGKACNFLHIFQNPNGLYSDYFKKHSKENRYDRRYDSRSRSRHVENDRDWRWSESPSRIEVDSDRRDSYSRREKSSKESKRRKQHHEEYEKTRKHSKRKDTNK